MGIRSYEQLKVWQKAMDFVERIYKAVEVFPKKEQYRLTDQLCRAAVSIPSNIAEGSSRKSTKEYARFVSIALGSVAETETQLTIARRLNYMDQETCSHLMAAMGEIGRMLNALYAALMEKINVH